MNLYYLIDSMLYLQLVVNIHKTKKKLMPRALSPFTFSCLDRQMTLEGDYAHFTQLEYNRKRIFFQIRYMTINQCTRATRTMKTFVDYFLLNSKMYA